MAIFEIEGPDGAIYEIDAPDEQSAISGFQQMFPPSASSVEAEIQQNLEAMGYQDPSQQGQQSQAYTSGILPFSRDETGRVSFDSNAGLLGMVKNAFMTPGRAMSGELQVMGPDGRTTPEAIEQGFNFASVFSPSAPAMRSGSGIIPGEGQQVRRSTPPAPSVDDLYAAADDSFNAMRETGVDYASDAVKNAALNLKRALESEGYDAEVAASTHRILDKLSNPPEGSVASIKNLHSARKTFRKIAQNFNNPPDQSAASQAIRALDDFIANPDPSAVLAGSADDAAAALRSANSNFAAAKRSDLLSGIERNADLRAAAANSGANTGNAIRQRVASAIMQPKQVSGFSPEEIAALESIVKGTPMQNATRYVGNLLGGGGGLGQMLTGGLGAGFGAASMGTGGAALGAAAPVAVGVASKGLSNALTRRALNSADEMVRMRSDLYNKIIGNAPMEVVRQPLAEYSLRGLMNYRPDVGYSGGW